MMTKKERFNLTVNCNFNLPRINIDTKNKLSKLKKFLDNFDEVD